MALKCSYSMTSFMNIKFHIHTTLTTSMQIRIYKDQAHSIRTR